MIDTDKYEGHTPKGWFVGDAPDVIHPTVIHSNEWDFIIAELVMANGCEWTEEDYANARLIADAPFLLAEVKRLTQLNYEQRVEMQRLHDAYSAIAKVVDDVGRVFND